MLHPQSIQYELIYDLKQADLPPSLAKTVGPILSKTSVVRTHIPLAQTATKQLQSTLQACQRILEGPSEQESDQGVE